MPPLLPGVGQRKRRVRSFFWKTIPEEQVKGRANLWTQGGVRQQYQIDVRTVEELFGQSEGGPDSAPGAAGALPGRGVKSRGSFREAKEEVSILDSKRGMNLAIFLKQFKRSNQTIVDDLHHGNSEAFGAEPLRELLKLLPETEEVAKLRSYRGDVAKLPLADSFMHALVQLPSYRLRIESMLLKEEFPAAAEAMRRDVQILRSAAKELMQCDELHAVLHLVLQAGNILNAGGYAGGAVGFKLSSLLSLADTKANKPGMNLLHFVALEAQKKDQKLLEFPLKLRHVQAAARISVETLDAELQWLTSRKHSVEESVRGDGELLQQLDHFLQRSAAALAALRGGRQRLQEEGSELVDFFCEDRDSFRLDDCFSVFNSFCSRFTHAVKENAEREAKEAARRRRVQELEEQKRHSWAGGEEVGGAFGFRCSSETDMSTAASRHEEAVLLVELLAAKPRPRSPMNASHSALGRSGSLRRSRNSPSTSPHAAAERELSAFLETATVDRKVPKAAAAAPTPKPGPCSFGASNPNHTTAADLGNDSSSDSNQQCDRDNNGGDQELSRSAAAPDRIPVLVEKFTLVPELKAFDKNFQPPSASLRRDNFKMADLDGEQSDQSGTSEASSPSQRQEDDRRQAAVWCVAGVCEANDDVPAQGEEDRRGDDGPEGRPPSSSAPCQTEPANGKPAPEPISSQPLPVARGDDPPGKEEEEEAARSDSATPPEPSADETTPREPAAAKVATSSKTAADVPTSQTGLWGVKTAASVAMPTGRPKSVRTLTGSERQGLRRVVPISRSGRGAPPTDPGSALHGRSQRAADPKGARSRIAPGARASPQERNPDSQTKTSVGKFRTEAQPAAEEKMCRSALRALSHARGGSVSSPATPLHRSAAAAAAAAARPASPLPGFARSTAASSFRRTRPTPPPPPSSSSSSSSQTPHAASDSSPSRTAVSPPTRSGSPGAAASSRPPGLPDAAAASSQPRRPRSTGASRRSSPRDSLAPPKGRRRNDSGEQSAPCRDSARAARPSWR